MNFPSKPWTNGQIAELISGSTFEYNSTKGAWLLVTSSVESSIIADNDSDFAYFNGKIVTIDGQIAAIETDISNLEARIDSDYALNNTKHALGSHGISTNRY